MVEKAAAIKRLEYSLSGKELKKQTSVPGKQYEKYKKLDNAFESNKNEEDKRENKTTCAKSNLVHNNHFTFYKCNNIKEFAKRSFDSKRNDLVEFKDKLELFYNDTIEIISNNEDPKKRKLGIDTLLELYKKLLNIYKTQDDKLAKAQKKRIKVQNLPENVPIDLYSNENNLPPISALEEDEEVKLEPEETIDERRKLNPQKRKKTEQDQKS